MNIRNLIIITIVVLLSVFVFRQLTIGNLVIGDLAYSDFSIVQSLNVGDATYQPDLFHYLFLGMSKILSLEYVFVLFSFIFSIVSIVFFYKILELYKLDSRLRYLAGLIFILSPQFISSYTISVRYGFSLMLILIGFYFTNKDSRKYYIGFTSFFIFSLLGFFHAIIAIVLLLSVFTFDNNRKHLYLALVLAVISMAYHLPNLIISKFIQFSKIIPVDNLVLFITDFGSYNGVGIFKFTLLLIGLFLFWKKNRYVLAIYLITVAITIFSYFFNDYFFLTNLVYPFFAAYSIFYFYKMKWKSQMLKNLTLVIILCGLLFSLLSFYEKQTNLGPSPDIIDGLLFLKTQEKGLVLSHYTNGFWIEFYSDMPALTNSKISHLSNPKSRYNDAEHIFYSRNLKDTQMQLNYHNISYIVITPIMKSWQIWSKKDEGLQFLFRNREAFDNIYDENGFEIWKINR